jgi:hypothetical protein
MLDQILDAMEYRPSNRHTSPHRSQHELSVSPIDNSLIQRGPALNQQSNNTFSNTLEDYTASGLNYTFKIITPKKTLVLSAPTEEEEVKWISAIRALIARRAKEKEKEQDHSVGHMKERREREADHSGPGGETAPNEERKRPISKGAPLSSISVASTVGGPKSGTTAAVNA